MNFNDPIDITAVNTAVKAHGGVSKLPYSKKITKP